MENISSSSEHGPIHKEEVIAILKQHPGEEVSMKMFGDWVEQQKNEIRENNTDAKAVTLAEFDFDMERLEVMIETGFHEIAKEELLGDGMQEGMIEVAEFLKDDKRINKANTLLSRIRQMETNEFQESNEEKNTPEATVTVANFAQSINEIQEGMGEKLQRLGYDLKDITRSHSEFVVNGHVVIIKYVHTAGEEGIQGGVISEIFMDSPTGYIAWNKDSAPETVTEDQKKIFEEIVSALNQ